MSRNFRGHQQQRWRGRSRGRGRGNQNNYDWDSRNQISNFQSNNSNTDNWRGSNNWRDTDNLRDTDYHRDTNNWRDTDNHRDNSWKNFNVEDDTWSRVEEQPEFRRSDYNQQNRQNRNTQRRHKAKKKFNLQTDSELSNDWDTESVASSHSQSSVKSSYSKAKNAPPNFHQKSETEDDKIRIAKEKMSDLKDLLNSISPLDLIKQYRQEVNKRAEVCYSNHAKNIEKIRENISNYDPGSKGRIIWENHQEILRKQLKTFKGHVLTSLSTLMDLHEGNESESIINIGDKIQQSVSREAKIFNRTLPIYAFKDEILSSIKANSVTVISADACYYASAVIPVFLENSLSSGLIVSCLPNTATCVAYYNNCKSFSGDGISTCGFEIENDCKKPNGMKTLFTTSKKLFHRTLSDPNLSSYSYVFINTLMKRSVEEDFLLERMKRLLTFRDDLKIVLLIQPPEDVKKFQKYFTSVANVGILPLQDIGLTVSIMWRKSEFNNSYIDDIIRTAVAIHVKETNGDVLIYLPSNGDAEKLSSLLLGELHSHGYNDVECLSVTEHTTESSAFETSSKSVNKRKFILTTDWAEQLIFPTVVYVIDPGIVKDSFYDTKSCLEVEQLRFMSKARAKVRKLSAGRLNYGKCYRLYNKQNYGYEFNVHEVPEVLKKNPFDILVRMFQYKLGDVMSIDFVDTISRDNKQDALDMLRNANAVKDGCLTSLGERIVKLPFQPRYSKMIIMGIEWGFAFETVVLVALFRVKKQIFLHTNDSAQQKRAETCKLQFLICDSDSLTQLNVYRSWIENKCQQHWCKEHEVNYNALQDVKEEVNSIIHIVARNLKESITTEVHRETEMDFSALQEIIFSCFQDNLCLYTGHYRSGYHLPRAKCMTFLHPSSSVLLRRDLPQFAVFNELQGGSRNYMINITAIPESLVIESSKHGRLHLKPSDLHKIKLEPFIIEPVGIILIKNVLLGKGGRNLFDVEKKIQQEVKTSYVVIEPNEDKGSVTVYSLPEHKKKVQEILQGMLQKKKETLLNEEETLPLELKKGHLTTFVSVSWSKGAVVSNLKAGTEKCKEKLKDNDASSEETATVSCSIELSWLRRLCKGTAFISFDYEDFSKVRRLSMTYLNIKGKDISIQVNRNVDNQLFLSNLHPETTEADIVKAIQEACPNVEVTKTTIARDKAFKTSKKGVESMRKDLERALTDKFPQSFNIVVLKPLDVSIETRAYVNFSEVEDISGNLDVFNEFFLYGVKVSAKTLYRCTVYCSKDIFQALKMTLEEVIQSLQNKYKNPDEDTPFQLNCTDKDYSTVCLNLQSRSLEVLNMVLNAIHKLLEGKVLDCSRVKGLSKLFTYGGHLWLNSLKRQLNMHIIEEYKNKSIRLYGPIETCSLAEKRIREFLEGLEDEVVKNIDLSNNKFGRSLLKNLIRKYGFDLKKFINKFELRSAEIDLRNSLLILHGSPENVEKAITEVGELASDLFDGENFLPDEEECSICTIPPMQLPLRLESCNHLYCVECLQGMIANSKFPIVCCAESCDKELILEDLRKALNYDEVEISQLLNRSMTDYISRNKDRLAYCPAPDCSMFYNKNLVTSTKWKCPLCQNEICTQCNVVYHQGLTCEFYQKSKDDPDYSFKVWSKAHPNCKRCPKCNTAIEKNQGCNHMTCWSCQAHFCWLCCQAFPTGDLVYRHQPSCPKRYAY